MKKVIFEESVYTYHIDFAGHVSNIVYIRWMEIGRSKLLEAAGLPVQELLKKGIVPVLVSTEITYKTPLFLGDQVRVEVWISRLTGATAVIEVRFFNSHGVPAASGSHRGVFVDRKTLRPLRLPGALIKAFEPYLERG